VRSPILLMALILYFLAPSIASAQGSTETLRRLQPNHLYLVQAQDEARLQGRLLSVTSDSLTLRSDTSLVSVAVLKIGSVHERKHSAGTGALLGMFMGGALGAVGGAAWSNSDSFLKPDSEAAGAVVVGLVGAGVGAGLGALVGSAIPHWRLRYRAGPRAS